MFSQPSYTSTISHISPAVRALSALLNVLFWAEAMSQIDVLFHHVAQPIETSTHPGSSELMLQRVRLNVHLWLVGRS